MTPSRYCKNPYFQPERPPAGGSAGTTLALAGKQAFDWHQRMEDYAPTPLHVLPNLAAKLGIRRLYVKNEAHRFGLYAFKVTGASYAMARYICERQKIDTTRLSAVGFIEALTTKMTPDSHTFAAATDGNHGRAVAWVARKLRQKAVIYIPKEMVPARRQAIEGEGAELVEIDGDYDLAVRRLAEDASRYGWHVISDTGLPGYEEIPRWIMAGYQTILFEVTRQSVQTPDIIFVQAGVGGLAAAVAEYYRQRQDRPQLVCVEPLQADCCMASIEAGRGEPVHARGSLRTIMAGLNCGTPSLTAWPMVKSAYPYFLAIDDVWARRAMQQLYRPEGEDPRVVAGESGAAGLAGLLATLQDDNLAPLRNALGLTKSTDVLVINTEGATDPENFHRIVGAP